MVGAWLRRCNEAAFSSTPDQFIHNLSKVFQGLLRCVSSLLYVLCTLLQNFTLPLQNAVAPTQLIGFLLCALQHICVPDTSNKNG